MVCAALLSSKTLLAMEVEVQGDDLVVRTLGSGAKDWFTNAPWEVCKGVLLRELVHADSWSSLRRLKDTLSGPRATGRGISSTRSMVLELKLSHFETSKYVCDHLDSTKPCALRSMNTVEYVHTTVQVTWSAHNAKMDTPPSATPEPAANHPHALLLFNTPESWQWVPMKPMANNATGPSEPANMLGHWVDVEDASSLPTLEQLIGSPHEFMGVFKLDKLEVIGVQDSNDESRVDAASVKQAGLEWISSLLFDPTTLLDISDQEMMENVVKSFEQMTRSRTGSHGSPPNEASSTDGAAARCRQNKVVTDCMELHSGIASTSLVDILTLSYRLKLPHALGGYVSAWRLLYSHILNGNAADVKMGSLTVIPSRRRGDASKVEVLLMLLHKDEEGKVCVSQQLCLALGADADSRASLTGLIFSSEVPCQLRLNISLRKVEEEEEEEED